MGSPKCRSAGWCTACRATERVRFEILLATTELIGDFGISSLYVYSGDREEERAAHRLYLRNGFEQLGWGKMKGDRVLYFKTKLPLVTSTEMGNLT